MVKLKQTQTARLSGLRMAKQYNDRLCRIYTNDIRFITVTISTHATTNSVFTVFYNNFYICNLLLISIKWN